MLYHVRDTNPEIVERGVKRIEWANKQMPVLEGLRNHYKTFKSLRGQVVGACLHITAETANLARTLYEGGASVYLCASNPLSTQDDVAAALVQHYRIPVHAVHGESSELYYMHLHAVCQEKPTIIIDDGGDMIHAMCSNMSQYSDNVICAMEETTTGVNRLRAMENEGRLKFPVIAVNDADTKHMFDNRYGTGQSAMDGVVRATDFLIAGKTVVVVGYGWCGEGIASRAAGMGATVIVCEVNPIRALEAAMEGYTVLPMNTAVLHGDVFITSTGNKNVISLKNFNEMKSGAVACNAGHFNVELDLETLSENCHAIKKNVRDGVDEYVREDGSSIYILGEGRLVNLACAEGHPACVMDMSFAVQAACVKYVIADNVNLNKVVNKVPAEIDDMVARLKLDAMGIVIDDLTPAQAEYAGAFAVGT